MASLPPWVAPLVTLVGIFVTGLVTIYIASKVNPWDKRARESILHELELAEKMTLGDRRDLVLTNLDRKVSTYVGRIALSPDLRLRHRQWLFVGLYGFVVLCWALLSFVRSPAASLDSAPGQAIAGLAALVVGGRKSSRIEKEMRAFRLSRNLLNDTDRLRAEEVERKRAKREARQARRNPPPVDPPEPREDF